MGETEEATLYDITDRVFEAFEDYWGNEPELFGEFGVRVTDQLGRTYIITAEVE